MAKRVTKKVNSTELDSKEFFAAIAQIEEEKGIKKGYMMEKITQALISAYRRDHEGVGDNLTVEANEETGVVRMFLKKEVVEEVDNPGTEISLEEARLSLPRVELGDTIRIEVKPKNFGRIAAQTARFSAFGKHAGNIVPIMAGVVLGSFVMHSSVSSGAVQLAMLFGTTLAPISGYFGWPYGVLAGFLHSAVVLYAGTPVAGLNLYNNGFSGGLLAIILYPTIVAIARHRKPVITEAEYFDHMEHDEPETPPPVQDMIEEED